MTKIQAYSALRELVEQQSAELNQFLLGAQNSLPEEDFVELRKIVAQIMGAGHYDAFLAIAEAFPNLKPAWAAES
jgi:hypothetical protein